MCVLIACESGVPKKTLLRYAWTQNPDGAGYAFVHRGTVRYWKGTGKGAMEQVLRFAAHPTFPCLIHFRWASIGAKVPALAHPMPVPLSLETAGVAPMVVAQNGHYSEWATILLDTLAAYQYVPPALKHGWSDTLALAYLLSVSDPSRCHRWLKKNAHAWGKVATLTPAGLTLYGRKGWTPGKGYQSSIPLEIPAPVPQHLLGGTGLVPASFSSFAGVCDICRMEDTEEGFLRYEGLRLCPYCRSMFTQQEVRG